MKTIRPSILAASLAATASFASAQTLPVALDYGHGFGTRSSLTMPSMSYQGRRDTWNTVLLVSGIIFVVGLIQDNSTLAILGGAGVIISLVQLNPSRFTGNSFARGLDLASAGPIRLGFSPFGQFGAVPGDRSLRPSVYASLNFKF